MTDPQAHIRQLYRQRWLADSQHITQDFAQAAKALIPIFERGAHAFDKTPPVQPGEGSDRERGETQDERAESEQSR